jgi:hypothetical protein
MRRQLKNPEICSVCPIINQQNAQSVALAYFDREIPESKVGKADK